MKPVISGLARLIDEALAEDIHTGDITTVAILERDRELSGRLVAKEPLTLSGIDVAGEVFRRLDPGIIFTGLHADGARIDTGTVLALVSGKASILLQGERVALNLLQRMCGVATMTAAFVNAVAGTRAGIVDTRKTTPGLRTLEKYSVRVGGGKNHRTGLYDGVLIKENHIVAAGGITAAVTRARNYIPHTLKIEVETTTLAEVGEAVAAGADIIMFDNMDNRTMREGVALVAGRALTEASGGVSLSTVRGIAETGVDIISVGALTHSVRAADISMLLEAP